MFCTTVLYFHISFIINSKPTSLLLLLYKLSAKREKQRRVDIIIFVPRIVLGAHKSGVVSSTMWNVHCCSRIYYCMLCLNKAFLYPLFPMVLNVINIILYVVIIIMWFYNLLRSISNYVFNISKKGRLSERIIKLN